MEKTSFLRAACLVGLAALTPAATTAQATRPVVHVYSGAGAAPALRQAAQSFGAAHEVEVEVISGPAESWREKALRDADVVVASSEAMMADLIRELSPLLTTSAVVPLYLRATAILVRPGNPKGIKGLPDLLKPGLRIMVVDGGGQAGVWEDVTGRLGDLVSVRALRANIAEHAASGGAARTRWMRDPTIDVWLTWETWQVENREAADLVPIEAEYRVWRGCTAAISARSRQKALAEQLVAFLQSGEGKEIFRRHGWKTD